MEKKTSPFVREATDVNYLDKNGLAKLLGTLNVDRSWKEVLSYRDEYRKELPWRLVSLAPLSIVRTPSLEGRFANVDEKLTKLASSLARGLSEAERKEARKSFYLPILKEVASWENIDISELSLKAMLNGTYSEKRDDHLLLLHYRDALDKYVETDPIPPSDDLLGEILLRLSAGGELLSFYREGKGAPTYALSADDKAPAGKIESYLDPFLNWLSDERDRLTPFLKAAAIAFYLPYVWPFEEHNVETAALFAKDLLALEYGAKETFFLPFEILLSRRDPEGEKARRNVRSSGDFTYFAFYAEKRVSRALSDWEELLRGAKVAVYAPEYDRLSEAERAAARSGALKQPLPSKAEQLTFDSFLSPSEEPLSEEPLPEKEGLPPREEAVSEPAPLTPEPVLGPLPTASTPAPKLVQATEPVSIKSAAVSPSPRAQEGKNVLAPSRILTTEELLGSRMAYGEEPDYLTEKEVKEYIRYLLETNPSLNRKQASFLATHRTEGRYYTIQQYKKYAHCVYETARTSMDKLAKEGYYTKMQVKNRFVYTPNKRR